MTPQRFFVAYANISSKSRPFAKILYRINKCPSPLRKLSRMEPKISAMRRDRILFWSTIEHTHQSLDLFQPDRINVQVTEVLVFGTDPLASFLWDGSPHKLSLGRIPSQAVFGTDPLTSCLWDGYPHKLSLGQIPSQAMFLGRIPSQTVFGTEPLTSCLWD